jgi:hypothetical protein
MADGLTIRGTGLSRGFNGQRLSSGYHRVSFLFRDMVAAVNRTFSRFSRKRCSVIAARHHSTLCLVNGDGFCALYLLPDNGLR